MRCATAREMLRKENEKFNKERSKAAEMGDEDPMESEDEYAGPMPLSSTLVSFSSCRRLLPHTSPFVSASFYVVSATHERQ